MMRWGEGTLEETGVNVYAVPTMSEALWGESCASLLSPYHRLMGQVGTIALILQMRKMKF